MDALLIDLHGLAALAGIGIALFAEIGRVRAVADGTIGEHERTYLARLGKGLVASVLVLIVADTGIAYLEYVANAGAARVLSAGFWFELTLIVFILADLWCMAKKYLPLWFGGASSLAAYGAIALLAFVGSGSFGYFGLLILYSIAIFIVGGFLEYGHILTRKYDTDPAA